MCLVPLPPIVSIIGYKNSGKTMLTTSIIKHLKSQNLRVLSAKHVGEPEFTLDRPGTDSFRHIEAGASAVFLHSEAATSLLFAQPVTNLTELIQRGTSAFQTDVIVVEGFKAWTQQDTQTAKIICVRKEEEINELADETQGIILAICSLRPEIPGTKLMPDDFPSIMEALDKWLKEYE